MAAFTHLNPEGSRFRWHYGVYYAARLDAKPRMAEVSHHRAVLVGGEPRNRQSTSTCASSRRIWKRRPARSARPAARREPDLYDAGSLRAPAQALGGGLRAAGSWGIDYHSVRHAAGLCVGAFRPRALGPCARHGAPRAALGRRTDHPLVREARAARALGHRPANAPKRLIRKSVGRGGLWAGLQRRAIKVSTVDHRAIAAAAYSPRSPHRVPTIALTALC